jgi:hypothetical protein
LKTITADTSWANRRCKTEDQRYYQAFQAKYGLGGRGPTTSPSHSSNINAHFNISQVPDVSAGEHENSGRSERLQHGDSPNESNRESLHEEFPIAICSQLCLPGRRLCGTHSGFLGLVPEATIASDFVAVFFGANVPFVIRAVALENSLEFEFVGPCYMHGAMDGEVVQSASTTQERWGQGVTDFKIRLNYNLSDGYWICVMAGLV